MIKAKGSSAQKERTFLAKWKTTQYVGKGSVIIEQGEIHNKEKRIKTGGASRRSKKKKEKGQGAN